MSQVSQRFAQMSPLKQALLALEEMEAKLTKMERQQTEAIAIIGMGCRFPGGVNDPESFWQLLHQGVDAIKEVPARRWNIDRYYDPDPDTLGKVYTRQGGFLDADIEGFDAEFFGLAPREVINMDPQQRLLLEVCWEALEHGGQVPAKLRGTQTGVFIGINTADYFQRQFKSIAPDLLNAYFFTGNTPSVAAGRLSYLLGLEGPSVALDTACSSSLVGVHLACQSLRNRESRMAIAGGVNLMLLAEAPIILSRMRALAADGRCKTFDASADGYGRGEGCGIVVLKRLSDAVADGDRILALIRGSAINHDGSSSGLTVPNGLAQQKVIRAALANGKVTSEEVSYVEVHGTGTALGDPIEVEALDAVFGKGRSPDKPLTIGSVKTNIGHLEAAAGVAGLIKVVLAMQHREIPPNLHFQTPNPSIPWDNLAVEIPTELTPWIGSENQPRMAGVSSFGMGGTNAHVILEEAPQEVAANLQPANDCSSGVLTLSAKTETALKALAEKYRQLLADNPTISLTDLCGTANTRRSHFNHRLAVTASSLSELELSLKEFLEDRSSANLTTGSVSSSSKSKIAFLFTGQGSQYPNMGKQLYDTQPVFRQILEKCQEILLPYLDKPLLEVIYTSIEEESEQLINQTQYTQSALFALEYALAQLWLSFGVRPQMVMGHSVGEYVAATIAGVFSLESALRLIAHRGKLMEQLPAGGGMVAVFASPEQLTEIVADYGDSIAIAAINGTHNTVLSGTLEAIENILPALTAREIEFRQLKVSHAFHSPLMEPMLASFRKVCESINYQAPQIALISNLTGKLVTPEEITNPDYWCNHVRQTVQFAQGMQTLAQQNNDYTVLEVGAHPVLIGMGQRCLEENNFTWLNSLRRGQEDEPQLLKSLASLYVQGVAIDWQQVQGNNQTQLLSLPTYPFERQRYWLDAPDASSESPENAPEHQDWLYQVEWQTQPLANVDSLLETKLLDSKEPGYWLIFTEPHNHLSANVASLLQEQGHDCLTVVPGDALGKIEENCWQINPEQPEQFERLLLEVRATTDTPCLGILHLWGLKLSNFQELSEDFWQTDRLYGCGSVLNLVQALSTAKIANSPRLWLVTQNAQSLEDRGDEISIFAAPLLGLSRATALEHPELWGGAIDLADVDSGNAAKAVIGEIWHPNLETEVAFRQGNRYVPRLVPQPVAQSQKPNWQIESDRTYLLTGGLGALGLKTASWLVKQGAKNLVLVGRRPPSEVAKKQITTLQDRGVQIVVARADISQQSEVARVLTDIATSLPPLGGIVHLAGVLDDGVLLKQDWQRFNKVMAPKIAGAWHLHELTQDLSLDFFVSFSSIASLIGSPGQSNYAAANAFLDALAHYRQRQQLPALTINWSPWDEAGMAANLGNLGEQRWTALGVTPLQPQQGFSILAELLYQSEAQVGILPFDWAKFFPQFPGNSKPALLAEIESALDLSPKTQSTASALLEELQKIPLQQRQALLIEHLLEDTAIVLGLNSSQKLSPQLGFFDMGMDSLMTLELKNRLQDSLGCSLSSTLTFEYPTIEALANYLATEVLDLEIIPTQDRSEPEAATEAEDLSIIEQLSVSKLEAFVNQELATLAGEN